MNKELFYIPNILSLARMVLIIPLAYLLLFQFTEQKTLIIIIMIAMYVTDLLDGYLARKLNQVSELGKIIDPLADKAAVIVITVILFVNGLIPVWFFTVIVLRDILILAFGLYLEKTRNITLMSNFWGKAAVFCIGIILLLTVINFEYFDVFLNIFYYIVLVLITLSLIFYYIRFKKTIGEKIYGC